MILQPPPARVRSGPQNMEASWTLADNAEENNRVANSKLRIIKDH
jgi:hypothetical protein